MSIRQCHPAYQTTLPDIELMVDSYAGERHMKEKGVTYLPPTPGMVIDGMGVNQDGLKKYENYKQRAVYPEFIAVAVESLLGMMHNKPATIEVPDGMKPMLERATADGATIQDLLRRINEQQLVTGRLGAMLDLPVDVDPKNPLPYIALYNAKAVRNWDDSADNIDFNQLSLVVLDESGFERRTLFNWVPIERYRVLTLGNGDQVDADTEAGGSVTETLPGVVEDKNEGDDVDIPQKIDATYNYAVFEGHEAVYDPSMLTTPLIRGVPLKEIPFVFINTKDNLSTPDKPPLLPLARAALSVYQGEADYRQALFLQGQDTLVVIGGVKNTDGADETRVGAGAAIHVDIGGDAKYIGVSATGLPELRNSLENDYKRAEAKTGQLVNTMGAQQESGAALQTRLGAQTATLNQIALSGAAGLEKLLKIAARWMGMDDSKVKVTPNLEFSTMDMTGKDLVDFQTAKTLGAPISAETIHDIMASRGLTTLSYQEEMDKIDSEAPIIGSLAGGGAPVLNTKPTPAPTPAPANKPGDKKGGNQ